MVCYVTVAPCWSFREVTLESSSSMKPSSTDSLSPSSPPASVGRNTWSWVRAGPPAPTGRSVQLRKHGFPMTNKGSTWKLGHLITVGRSPPSSTSVAKACLCASRLAGPGFEKWMKVGLLQLWTGCWFCCCWGWLENGGAGGRFCKTLRRGLLDNPSYWWISWGFRRAGSLRL